jgi:hypothetical protein
VDVPNETKSSHTNGLEIGVSRGDLECGSEDLSAYKLGHGEYVVVEQEGLMLQVKVKGEEFPGCKMRNRIQR